MRHAFSLKNTRNWRGRSCVTNKFTVTLNAGRILPEKTQGILGGWWRSEEGVYIDKEQRYGGTGDAEIASEERRGNGEVRRGWICRNRMGVQNMDISSPTTKGL